MAIPAEGGPVTLKHTPADSMRTLETIETGPLEMAQRSVVLTYFMYTMFQLCMVGLVSGSLLK